MFDLHKLLCEIGFLGIQRNINQDMAIIFHALRMERPENACGFIGAALLSAKKGDFDQAISALEPALESCSEAVEEARQLCDALRQIEVQLV